MMSSAGTSGFVAWSARVGQSVFTRVTRVWLDRGTSVPPPPHRVSVSLTGLQPSSPQKVPSEVRRGFCPDIIILCSKCPYCHFELSVKAHGKLGNASSPILMAFVHTMKPPL